jgi:formylglycine-generating enzyme required for sulfatase activity
MTEITAGTFMMGSTNGPLDEIPVHEVTIAQNFQLGVFPVTKLQWEAVMGTTPWSGLENVLEDPDSPATNVSWDDVQVFIEKLNGLTGETFRLPTEAEWEYACRAGTTTEFFFGDSDETLSDYAWWEGNARLVGENYAHVVGQKLPNAFGLFDIIGNSREWCEDWYDSSYYETSPANDPTGPAVGSGGGPGHLIRGGDARGSAFGCRSAKRDSFAPQSSEVFVGFRLAR